MTLRAAVRGAKVNSTAWRVRSDRPCQHAQCVAGAVMDQRVHCHHVVETSERGIEHVADVELDCAAAEFGWQALTREADQGGREIDRDDVCAAPGGLDGQSACAAAGIENACAVQVFRAAS